MRLGGEGIHERAASLQLPDEDEIYSSNIEPHFAALAEEDRDRYLEEFNRFNRVNTFYKV